jgi:hypothetical protein
VWTRTQLYASKQMRARTPARLVLVDFLELASVVLDHATGNPK